MDLAYFCAEIASSKKAEDIVILDISKHAAIANFFVIASVESSTQLRAIQEELEKKLYEKKIKPIRLEGKADSGWILVDAPNVIVHLFHKTARKYYNIEVLWQDKATVYHI